MAQMQSLEALAEAAGLDPGCLPDLDLAFEISPDLPAFFDPLDVHALVALVERTLRDPEWVRAREAEIRARFVSTPWTHTAAQVRTGIEAATAAGRRREAA